MKIQFDKGNEVEGLAGKDVVRVAFTGPDGLLFAFDGNAGVMRELRDMLTTLIIHAEVMSHPTTIAAASTEAKS